MSTLYFGRVEGADFEKMTNGARRRAEARSWFDGICLYVGYLVLLVRFGRTVSARGKTIRIT